jgi:hypothetical protein
VIGVEHGVVSCGPVVEAIKACHHDESTAVAAHWLVALGSVVIWFRDSLDGLAKPRAIGSRHIPDLGWETG